MSKPSEQLARVRRVIDTVTTKVGHGTADTPRLSARIDLAFDRASDRAGGGQLPGPTRGGSSSPEATEERTEADRVKRQAEKDARAIVELVASMHDAAHKIERIVDRQAETVHPGKLPTNVLPGCRSCARKEQDGDVTIGGHWAEVYPKAPSVGLCRQCWDFKAATGGLPPIKWCHKLHTGKRNDANRWLGENFPNLLRDVQRKKPEPDEAPRCATEWWHQGTTVRCNRAQDHDPSAPEGCRGVVEGRSISFPTSTAESRMAS